MKSGQYNLLNANQKRKSGQQLILIVVAFHFDIN